MEDLKLNKLRCGDETQRLTRMLVRMALAIDPYKKAAYIEYYIREYPNAVSKEEAEKSMSGKMMRDGVDIEAVPKVFKWVEDLLKGKINHVGFIQMPIFYEKTRKLVRLYEIMSGLY